ncbi:MAG: phosphoglycolate phosphatase [Rhodothermales bacterium]|jgi:phosphoglycolate phosphatase
MIADAILFDLDGTLVDTVPDITDAVNVMLSGFDRPTVTDITVGTWMGNGVARLVERALANAIDAPENPPEFDAALAKFSAAYSQQPCCRSQLYPGARELLESLRSSHKLAIVTNKAAKFTPPLLESLGIDHFFGAVVCGDTLPTRKPDPAPLFHALSLLGADAGRAVAVGDSVTDVRAAHNASIPVVAVSFGYNHGHPIADSNPNAVIDHLGDLPAAIARL